MEHFSDDQIKEAKEFGEFYVDIIENYKNNIKYYLSNDVILDWFGQTVKGEKNVAVFLKTNVSSVKHLLSSAVPVHKIGFRDSHVVKLTKESKKLTLNFMSPSRNDDPKTPPKQTQPSTSSSVEKGQGDGFHNNCDTPMSPAKRFKPAMGGDCLECDNETVECESEDLQVKYMEAEGSVQFRKSSIKKLQAETRWQRPCKLSVAYTSTNFKDCTIYLIIYEGNMKCRRNLMKDFEAEEPEN